MRIAGNRAVFGCGRALCSGSCDVGLRPKLLLPNDPGGDIAAAFQPTEISMQVLFMSRHPQADELRGLAERRVRFVLRRLSWLVPRAKVQLSDMNGPRGGIDKHCRVELSTDGAGPVVVASVAKDWRTALDDALGRAARYLLRSWRRGGDPRRLRQRLTGSER
jgi:hypothetical protein